MSEGKTLGKVVSETIENYLAENGGGFLTGFLFVAETVQADGQPALRVVTPGEQAPHRSLGLTSFAHEWVKDDVARMFDALDLPGDWSAGDESE